MYTTETARLLSERLMGAPDGWIRSPQGRALIARGLRLLRSKGSAGRADARTLQNSLYIAAILEPRARWWSPT